MDAFHPQLVTVRRTALLARIADALGGEPARSVVISGPVGSGTAELSAAAVGELSAERAVFRIRGTRFGSASPYMAIEHLVDGALGAGDPPVLVARRLDDALAERSAGRAPLLHILNFESLDPESAALLTGLLASGRVSAVITCVELVGQDGLLDLLTAGSATAIPAAALTPEEVRESLEDSLGGIVPDQVGRRLAEACSGNAALLELLCRQGLHTGWLAQEHGVWLLGAAMLWDADMPGNDAFFALHAALPAEAREVLARLAVIGPIPIRSMLEEFALATLVSLEGTDLIRADSAAGDYGLAGEGIAAALLGCLGAEEVGRIWREVGQPLRERGLSIDPARLLVATREGVPASVHELFRAAHEATQAQNPDLSDAILDAMNAWDDNAALLRSLNARQRGEISEALRFARFAAENPSHEWNEASGHTLVFLIQLEECADVDAATLTLAALEAWAEATGNVESAASLIGLAQFTLWNHSGEHDTVIYAYEHADIASLSAQTGSVVGMLYAEALCVRGRQAEGLAIARRSFSDAREEARYEIRDLTFPAMWRVLLLCGRWAESAEVLAELRAKAPHAGGRNAVIREASEGHLQLLRGDEDAARRAFLAARALIERMDPERGNLAGSVLAHAVPGAPDGGPVLSAERERSAHAGAEAERLLARHARLVSNLDAPAIPEHLRVLARLSLDRAVALVVEPARGFALLAATAERSTRRGHHGYALLTRASQVRQALELPPHPESDALRARVGADVTAALASNTGELAQLCGVFASALFPPAGPATRTGIMLADALGLGGFFTARTRRGAGATPEGNRSADRVADRVSDRTTPQEPRVAADREPGARADRAVGRPTSDAVLDDAAPGVEPRAAARLAPAPSAPQSIRMALGLSAREALVFEALARGMRNREIAESLGISPRTAEGHVQRLYRSLGVRSRSELALAYPREFHRAAAAAVMSDLGLAARAAEPPAPEPSGSSPNPAEERA